jgi:transposase-like protein
MTHFETPRCPACRGSDVQPLGRTRAGQRFRCQECGTGWVVTVEDEVLGMIGDSLRARRIADAGGSDEG